MTSAMKKMLIALTAASTFSVFADADGPDFYEVQGVKMGDTLNIRQYPTWKSKKVGEIPYNDKCVGNEADWAFGLTAKEFNTMGEQAIENALKVPMKFDGTRLLTTGEIIRYFDDEAKYEKLRKKRKIWTKIKHHGVEGWVNNYYLRESSADYCHTSSD